MDLQRDAVTICFSPTGTTRRYLSELKGVLGLQDCEDIDLRRASTRQKERLDLCGSLVVIATCVYEEHIPKIVDDYLERVNLTDSLVIGLVVYGKVGFGMSLKELDQLIRSRGGRMLAAGACIARHSWSTPDAPLAEERPDEEDLHSLRQFALRIKIPEQTPWTLQVPGRLPLLSRVMPGDAAARLTRLPVLGGACRGCGACVRACPTGAVDDSLTIDRERCVRCFACVRVCPDGVRHLKFTHPLLVRTFFALHERNRKTNRYFLPDLS